MNYDHLAFYTTVSTKSERETKNIQSKFGMTRQTTLLSLICPNIKPGEAFFSGGFKCSCAPCDPSDGFAMPFPIANCILAHAVVNGNFSKVSFKSGEWGAANLGSMYSNSSGAVKNSSFRKIFGVNATVPSL
jgi:hypothetical protein